MLSYTITEEFLILESKTEYASTQGGKVWDN
jgi:hypothetical protein